MNIIDFREAGRADQIVELGRRMFAESRFARLGFDADLAEAYAQRMVLDPLSIAFGAYKDDAMVGMVVGMCGASLPFTRSPIANQHLLYIAPEYRRGTVATKLIRAFIAEAKSRGARDITFSNGTGYESYRVGKLFQACGLSQVGGIYVQEV